MKSPLLKLFAASIIGTVAHTAMCQPAEAPARLLTLPYPPFTIETGANAPGAIGEIVMNMSKRMGIPDAKVEFFPWARSQMIAKSQPHAVIFPIDRSSEREDDYRWIVQLHCRVVGFVALKSFAGDLDHGESLKPYKVGVLRASPSKELLKSLMLPNIIEGNDYADLVKMLQKRMVDVIFGTQEISIYELTQAGLRPGEFTVGKPSYSRGIWLAANLAMPDAEVAQWRRAFDQVAQDGTYRRTLRKYQIAEQSCK